jgi:hypothetical protein
LISNEYIIRSSMKIQYQIMVVWCSLYGMVYAAENISAEDATHAIQETRANTFAEGLAGDVVGNQNNTVVATIGGQPAAHIVAAVQTVQQATSDYSNNTLVCRDAQGDFSARNIRATLLGNATTAGHANTFNKPLAGDVIGKQFATVVTNVGGESAAQIATATQTVRSAAATNIPSTLILRDEQGDFAARIIAADVQGNATTATHAQYADHATHADQAVQAAQANMLTEPLAGDVVGNQSSTVVIGVGGQLAAQIAAAVQTVQSATASNVSSTLILRDEQGDFAARIIAADLQGNAATATHAQCADQATQASTFTEPLAGDVVGNQNSTVVIGVGGQLAAQIAAATLVVQSATASNTPNTLIMRDEYGNCAVRMITIYGSVTNLTDVATKEYVDTLAASTVYTQDYSTTLAGDVVGNQTTTVVATVGGQSAAQVAAATDMVSSATAENMPSSLVLRNAQGDFSAHIITTDVRGNATTATHAQSADQATCANTFTESLAGDVVGNQSSTVVAIVGGQSAAQIAAAVQAVQSATASITPSTLVMRDEQGDIRAHTIKANLLGSVTLQGLSGAGLLSVDEAGAISSLALTSKEGTIAITPGEHTLNIEVAPAKALSFYTDAGMAIPKAGSLAIRGGQNLRVRASDSSVVISLTASPSVTGSLTAGTTVTAGTGLQVVSGGAAIMGETKINIAGSAATTMGNPSSSTIFNGPLCFKHVNESSGTPLAIDADGNVVVLSSSNERVYRELMLNLIERYPEFADALVRSSSESMVPALLRALITIIDEQRKKLECIEHRLYKQ